MGQSPSSLAKLSLEIALAEASAGIYEDPPHGNRGLRVDEYQAGRAVLGQAWCLKFVHWCYSQAGIRLGVPNPLPKLVANSFSSVEGNTWATDQEKEGVYVVKRLHVINYEFVRIES